MVAQGSFMSRETGRFTAPVAQRTAILAQMYGKFKWSIPGRARYGVSLTDLTDLTDRWIVVAWDLDRTSRNVDDSSQ